MNYRKLRLLVVFLTLTINLYSMGGEFEVIFKTATSLRYTFIMSTNEYTWKNSESGVVLWQNYSFPTQTNRSTLRFDSPDNVDVGEFIMPWGLMNIQIVVTDNGGFAVGSGSVTIDFRDQRWATGYGSSIDTRIIIDNTSENYLIYLSKNQEIGIDDVILNGQTINIWDFWQQSSPLTTNFKVPITLYNKIENTNTSFGYLNANGHQVVSGDDELFKYNTTQTVTQGTIDKITDVRNYSFKWNRTSNITVNQNLYLININFTTDRTVDTREITRIFHPVYPLTIKNSLDELGGISVDNIYFKDPTTTNSYESKSATGSGFYKDNAFYNLSIEATGELNQKYGAKAKQQIIYNDKTYNYLEGDFTTSGTDFLLTAATTKTAYYKGQLLSNATVGFSSNSQRKIVRTDDGKLHLVYESMGSVWYTISTDNGITWQPEQRVNPYDTYAKGVSIAQSDDGLNYVYIVYQIDRDVFPNLSKGVVITQYHYGVQQWARTVYNLSTYDYDTKTVVAAQNNVAYVVFKPTSTSQLRAAKVSSSGVVNTSFALNNTTPGSVNPSLAAAVQNFYLAYQNNSTEIRYFKFSVNGSISDYAVVSSGSGFTYNINPSLSTYAGDPVVSWSGSSSSIPAIVIRRKSDSTWSTIFKKCDNGTAAYPSNNNSKGSGTDGSIIAWTNMYNQSRYIRFVNGEYSTIKNLPNSGQDIQIGNGYEFDQLKAVTFNRSGAAPFGINPLQYNFNTMQKTTTEEEFNYARIAVIGKENAEIVYGLGDIKLNNENILFTRLNDMVQLNNTQDLSSAMKTENFVLSKDSKLEFSDCAYVINGDSVDLTATEILPIIELVNLSNGMALKVKDISISIKDTIDEKTYYVLNCSYLPEGTYYLRVDLDTEEQYEYNISDCIYEENEQLKKKDYKEIVLEDNLLPKEFSLEQNFPNPFNPSTKISWQSPVTSHQTLKVYDILGNEVATLVDEFREAGKYEVNFDASKLASGVYIYKIQAGSYTASKKLMLLK